MLPMDFEWDEEKDEQNRKKHGIPFGAAADVLLRPHVEQRSDRKGERRWVAVGPLEGRLIAVVFTKRGDTFRIISARRARANEREWYRTEIG